MSFVEARSIIAQQAASILATAKPDVERCDLSECLGRVLASPLLADRDQPPFARVIRDGYAVHAHDIATGSPLRVIGQVRAGESWPLDRAPLQVGEAIEIMTGAPLPPGADAVIMVEHVEEIYPVSHGIPKSDDSEVGIVPLPGRNLIAGQNVVPRGGEALQSQRLLEPGQRLDPDAIGLAVSCGARFLDVFPLPRVAILATGDEIVELNSRDRDSSSDQSVIEPYQIYDSNTHVLAAMLRQNYAIPISHSTTPDRKRELSDSVLRALKGSHIVILTGGVSMGRYDLVQDVLAELGTELLINGAKIQPGKPVVFGRFKGQEGQPRFIFGLPGNPISALVTFRLFVQPLLAAVAGERNWQPRTSFARLAGKVESKLGLTRFLPAFLDTARREPTVTAVPTQGSGDLVANARANCYIIVPDRESSPAEGQLVHVLLR